MDEDKWNQFTRALRISLYAIDVTPAEVTSWLLQTGTSTASDAHHAMRCCATPLSTPSPN